MNAMEYREGSCGMTTKMIGSKSTRRRFLLTAATTAAALPLLGQETGAKALTGLKDRTGEAPVISAGERQARADKARKLMQQRGISALCITGGTSLVYFTGIRSGQSERLFAWVLPATGAPYIVCPVFEEGRMTEQLGSIPDGASTKIYTWNEDENPYYLLTKHLPEGRLAMDERVQFVFADGIQKADPWRKIVSAIPVVSGCRAVKSAAELGCLALANEITLAVYEAAWRVAGPGTTNKEFSELVAKGYGMSGVQGEASCQVGEWSALPHGSPRPQVIREGEIVLIDDGCTVNGYQSDISRTFVYGKSTEKQRQVFDVVKRAQAAALAAARPGVACEAIDAAARGVVTAAGFGPDYRTFTHRVGHGIGMDGHEWPYLVRGNSQALEVGMCFSDEPGIYLKGEFGVRLEDDWHVTGAGGVLFTGPSLSLEKPFG